MMKFSKHTGGFYNAAIHAGIPSDAVSISDDLYDSLLGALSLGASIDIGPDGLPFAYFPVKQVDALALEAQQNVDSEYTRRMSALANNYPAHERESWPVQLAEAQALQANEGAITPWIDQCATQRGLARIELATRILQKDTAYRQVSGLLTGIRQWHEDQISALLEAGEASRQALQDYDANQGWPSADLREPQPA